MKDIFFDMSEGTLESFIDAMAEDMEWIWMGTGQWSHTFKGKESGVILAAIKSTLTEPFEVTAHRFITEGDYVVIEHSGKNTTTDGKPYNHNYCWICRFSESKLRELRENMDTGQVTKTFCTNS